MPLNCNNYLYLSTKIIPSVVAIIFAYVLKKLLFISFTTVSPSLTPFLDSAVYDHNRHVMKKELHGKTRWRNLEDVKQILLNGEFLIMCVLDFKEVYLV